MLDQGMYLDAAWLKLMSMGSAPVGTPLDEVGLLRFSFQVWCPCMCIVNCAIYYEGTQGI